jgi:hypothetical protein
MKITGTICATFTTLPSGAPVAAYSFFTYDASKHGSGWIKICDHTIEFKDTSIIKSQIRDALESQKQGYQDDLTRCNGQLKSLESLEITP